jgi:hypothetical protein
VASTTTTSTEPPTEVCDNCLDDDGDGLVDMEDDACCPSPATFRLTKGYLRPRKDGTAKVRLKGPLSGEGLPALAASSRDLTIQIRTATDEVLCARVPAADLVRRKTKLKFRDARARVGSALGLTKATIRARKDGTGHLGTRGRSVVLTVPRVAALTTTLGLRDPATAEGGNYCARGTAVYRVKKKRGLRYP